MSDIWDGLGKTHVIIALTPDECKIVLKCMDNGTVAKSELPAKRLAYDQIIYGLRDQKGIEYD